MRVDDAQVRVQTRTNDEQLLQGPSRSVCTGTGCSNVLPHDHGMDLCSNCVQAMKDVQPTMSTQQAQPANVHGWAPPSVPLTLGSEPQMLSHPHPIPIAMQLLHGNPYPPGGTFVHYFPIYQYPPMVHFEQPQIPIPTSVFQNSQSKPKYVPMPAKIVAPHFNSQGEFIHPDLHVPQPQPNQHSNHHQRPLHYQLNRHPPLPQQHTPNMCARTGCSAILPSDRSLVICVRCEMVLKAEGNIHGARPGESSRIKLPGGMAEPPTDIDMVDAQTLEPKQMSSQLPTPPTSSCSPTMPPLPIPGPAPVPITECLGGQLGRSPKPHQPSQKKLPTIKLKLTIPRRPPLGTGGLPKPTSLPTPATPPLAGGARPGKVPTEFLRLGPLARACSTPGCSEGLMEDSVSGRCFKCVKKHWKSRARMVNTDPKKGKGKMKRKRKRVTWADGIEGGGALGSGDEDEDELEEEDEEGWEDLTEDESGNLIKRLVRRDSGTPTPSVEDEMEMEVTSVSGSDDESGGAGWDSDVTDLEESESESEEEDETEEEGGGGVQSQQPTGLKIRIPARPRQQGGPSAAGMNTPSLSGEIGRSASSSTSTSTSTSTSSSPEPTSSLTLPVLCAIRKCSAPLAAGYRWKSCVSCRVHLRESQRKRNGIDEGHMKLNRDTSRTDFLPMRRFLPDDIVPGARLCSVKSCTHILPGRREYKWKLCELCRMRSRDSGRMRKKLALLNANKGVDSVGDVDMEEEYDSDEPLINRFLATLRPASGRENQVPGRCRSRDCGILLRSNATDNICRQCKARKRQPIQLTSKPPRDCMRNGQNTKPPPYPEYKNLPTLLLMFRNRLRTFFQVQALNFHVKSAESEVQLQQTRQQQSQPSQKEITAEVKPGKEIGCDIRFAGEFSVVALDYDMGKRLEPVKQQHLKIKNDMAEETKLEFSPNMWISILDNGAGIISRFVCVYNAELPVASVPPVPAPAPVEIKSEDKDAGDKPDVVMTEHDSPVKAHSPSTETKPMRGELEISTFPDRTHLLFAGERTIVRFRLVG